jgi:predicted DNA-binding ribbon-helix-helix protein
VRSLVLKRSLVIAGRKTSVSIEEEFWKSVKEIAAERNMTVTELVREIDANRQQANLSSAIRLFVIGVYRDRTDLAKDRKAEPESSRIITGPERTTSDDNVDPLV